MPKILTNYESGGDTDYAIGDSGGAEYVLGQSFQIPETATLYGIGMYLKLIGTPASDLSITIQTDVGGTPSGTLANANGTISQPITGILTTYDWINMTFGTPFQLTGTTTYWLVGSTPAGANNNCYVDLADTAGTYASGQVKYRQNLGTWINDANTDAYFRIYGPSLSVLTTNSKFW